MYDRVLFRRERDIGSIFFDRSHRCKTMCRLCRAHCCCCCSLPTPCEHGRCALLHRLFSCRYRWFTKCLLCGLSTLTLVDSTIFGEGRLLLLAPSKFLNDSLTPPPSHCVSGEGLIRSRFLRVRHHTKLCAAMSTVCFSAARVKVALACHLSYA